MIEEEQNDTEILITNKQSSLQLKYFMSQILPDNHKTESFTTSFILIHWMDV